MAKSRTPETTSPGSASRAGRPPGQDLSAADEPLSELAPGSFVYAFPNNLPADLCREMIRRFEAHPAQQYVGRTGEQRVQRQSVKRSTDLRISGREEWRDIDRQLHRALAAALTRLALEFPFFATNRFRDVGYNLQRSAVGEYYHWHVDSGPGELSQRQLAALWYLNELPGPGGETEFALQGLRVSPQTGKLLIFPPFWTHIHRGVAVRSGTKYVATTWLSFVEGDQQAQVP